MIAFVFPGQGSQYVGMGAELAAAFPEARDVLEHADHALGFPLSRLMAEGPAEELKQTVNTQPAVVAHSLAALAVVRARGLEPAMVAGHSVGEYAAVAACGALDVEETLRLVRQRGRFMQEAGEARPSGMAALIGADVASAEALCAAASAAGPIEVANLNAPGQIVISGTMEGLDEAVKRVGEFGIRKAIRLEVSGAFHSCVMQPAADRLEAELRAAALRDPAVPLVANRTAEPVADAETLRQALIEQVISRVRWEESVRRMVDSGVTAFLELGPGTALAGMVKRIAKDVTVASAQDPATLEKALEALRAS